MAADWVGNVLDFWFAELTAEDWFTRKDTTDEAIRQRFGALWEEFQAAVPAAAFRDPDAALAATIALLQLLGSLAPSSAVLPLGLPWIGAHFRIDALSADRSATANVTPVARERSAATSASVASWKVSRPSRHSPT